MEKYLTLNYPWSSQSATSTRLLYRVPCVYAAIIIEMGTTSIEDTFLWQNRERFAPSFTVYGFACYSQCVENERYSSLSNIYAYA